LFAKFAFFARGDAALDLAAHLGIALDETQTEPALGLQPADDLVGLGPGRG
jgi:hypothetical protein